MGSSGAIASASSAGGLIQGLNIAGGGNSAGAFNFKGTNGSDTSSTVPNAWQLGIDVSAPTPCRDFVITRFEADGTVTDYNGLYGSHNGALDASWAFGQAQPDGTCRLRAVGSQFAGRAFGSLAVRAGNAPAITPAAGGANGAGFVMVLREWSGKDHAWWDNSNANTWTLRMRGDSNTANPSLVVQDITTDQATVTVAANGNLTLKNPLPGGGVSQIQWGNVNQTGRLTVLGTGEINIGNAAATAVIVIGNHATSWNSLGFFGTAAAAKQTVTGALSLVADVNAKTVLTSILAALAASYGLVTDGTT